MMTQWGEEPEDEDLSSDVPENVSDDSLPAEHSSHNWFLAGLGAFADLFDNNRSKTKYRIGDHVRVRYRGQEGTVIDINRGLYMVSLDNGNIDSFDG